MNSEDPVLEALTRRFDANDYIQVSELPPHSYEKVGLMAHKLFRDVTLLSNVKRSRSIIGNPMGATFPEKLERTKTIATQILSQNDIRVDDAELTLFNQRIQKYRFLAGDLDQFIADAFEEGRITILESRVLKKEIRELSQARGPAQIQSICATVEFEIYHSDLSQKSKDKLILFNCLLRNLSSVSFLVQAMPQEVPMPEETPFRKAALSPLAVGVFFVLVVIAAAEALSDPNCGTSCQNAIIGTGVTMIGVGALVCCCAENNYGYTPCDQQYIP